ncbi:1283_t:CDS:2, partial [Dentiscutata heterogama]
IFGAQLLYVLLECVSDVAVREITECYKDGQTDQCQWLPLAPFGNYSQWSNGAMSMELFSIRPNG